MVRIPRIHELPAGEYILPAVPPVHGDIGFQSGLDYEQQKDVCPLICLQTPLRMMSF